MWIVIRHIGITVKSAVIERITIFRTRIYELNKYKEDKHGWESAALRDRQGITQNLWGKELLFVGRRLPCAPGSKKGDNSPPAGLCVRFDPGRRGENLCGGYQGFRFAVDMIVLIISSGDGN